MTIETTAIKAVALGNGVTTIWPYTFLIPNDNYVVLTLVDVVSGNPTVIAPANYTVTGAGSPYGGTVTYPLSGAAVTSAYYVVIERVLPLEQETDLQNQGAVYPVAIENALDYLTMLTQQLQDQLNRAIIFSVADTIEVTLPSAAARAGLFLGFDSNGDPVALDGLTAGTTVSAAMIPVVTAPTTAAALIALGVPGSLLDALIPAGTIWDFSGGTVAPSGFAFPYGQAITGTYPVLRAALVAAGSPFGTNGVDPLGVDVRSRTIVGKSNMGGVDNGLWTGGTVLGAIAGAQSISLTLAQMAIHAHANTALSNSVSTDSGHTHTYTGDGLVGTAGGGGVNVYNPSGSPSTSTGYAVITTSTTTAMTNANAGSGDSHENRMPGLILNKIMKVH